MRSTDNDEFKRLSVSISLSLPEKSISAICRNKQHHALKLAFPDGLYPCGELVNAILDPSINPKPKILDLGMLILVISLAVLAYSVLQDVEAEYGEPCSSRLLLLTERLSGHEKWYDI